MKNFGSTIRQGVKANTDAKVHVHPNKAVTSVRGTSPSKPTPGIGEEGAVARRSVGGRYRYLQRGWGLSTLTMLSLSTHHMVVLRSRLWQAGQKNRRRRWRCLCGARALHRTHCLGWTRAPVWVRGWTLDYTLVSSQNRVLPTTPYCGDIGWGHRVSSAGLPIEQVLGKYSLS